MTRLFLSSTAALLIQLLVVPPAWAAWVWPLSGEVITPYRNGADPYAGGQHRGIDIAGDPGAPVVAAEAGTVRFAGTAGSSGLTVSVRTADGRYDTSYLHLSSIAVREGEPVAAGARVGAVGTTGVRSAERAHLHFGVRDAGSRHAYHDPLTWLPPPPAPADLPRGAPAPQPLPVPAAPAPAPVRVPAGTPAPEEAPARRRAPAGRRVPAGRRAPVRRPQPGGRRVPAGEPAGRPVPGERRVPAGEPALRPRPVGAPRPALVPGAAPLSRTQAPAESQPREAGEPGRETGRAPATRGLLGAAAAPSAPTAHRAAPSAPRADGSRAQAATPPERGAGDGAVGGAAGGGLDLGLALACLGLVAAAALLGLSEDGRAATRRSGRRAAALLRPLWGRR